LPAACGVAFGRQPRIGAIDRPARDAKLRGKASCRWQALTRREAPFGNCNANPIIDLLMDGDSRTPADLALE
jgi:hypothetical protein